MDHSLKPQRQFEKRARRPDRERIEISARGFHRSAAFMVMVFVVRA
jgi:hypothetical protein